MALDLVTDPVPKTGYGYEHPYGYGQPYGGVIIPDEEKPPTAVELATSVLIHQYQEDYRN